MENFSPSEISENIAKTIKVSAAAIFHLFVIKQTNRKIWLVVHYPQKQNSYIAKIRIIEVIIIQYTFVDDELQSPQKMETANHSKHWPHTLWNQIKLLAQEEKSSDPSQIGEKKIVC